MRSGLIVTKHPGKIINSNFLLEAVTTHPTAVGFATVKDGQVIHEVFDPAEKDLLDAMLKTMEKFKDSTVYFHLTKADESDELELEDLQPYVLLTKGNQTQLAVMLEGEFPAYAGGGSPETKMVNEYLRGKVESIYKDSGNNLNTLLTKLDSAQIRADFKPQLMPRGVILYIPAKGKAFAMSDNKMGGAYTWGFASKNLGIATDIVPEPEKEPVAKAPVQPDKVAKPLTFKEKAALKAALKLEQEGGPGVKKPEKVEEKKDTTMPPGPSNNPPPDQKTNEESPFFYNEAGVLSCKPRTGCSWDEAKLFWKRNCSLSQPANQAEVYEGFPAASLRPNAPLFDRIKKEQMPTQFKDAMKKAEEEKTLKAKAGSDEVPGILTGEEKKQWVEFKKKTDFWNKKPEELMAMVKPTSLLSEQVQIPLQELLYSSPGGWMRLGKRDLILLAHQFRMECIKLSEQLASPRTSKIEEAHAEAGALPPTKDEAPPSNRPLTFKEKAALKAAKAKAA